MERAAPFFRPGGTLEPSAASYIVRKADGQLLEALVGGEYVFLLDSRQKGKSSLVARAILKLREHGVLPVKLDLQRVGANLSPDQWYAGLAFGIGQELGLHREVFAYWKDRQSVGPLARFVGVLEDVILDKILDPLVIFIDEVDFVRALDFSTDEFFAAIRDCHNRRSNHEAFRRLTFCLAGVATPGQLIRNPDISPFNIGLQIELTDFSLDETAPYADEIGASSLQRVHYWVNGHPYLTQLLCSFIAARSKASQFNDVDKLIQETFLSPGGRQREANLSDVERRMLHPDVPGLDLDEARVQVLEVYRRMLHHEAPAASEQDPVLATLRLSGVGVESDGVLRVRNRLYRRVFDEKWRQQNLPDADVRRQRMAARRAVLKTLGASGVIAVLLGAAGVNTWRISNERMTALNSLRAKTIELENANYSGLMADVRLALTEGRWMRASALLKSSENNVHRGWEWGHAALALRRHTDAPDLPPSPMMFEPLSNDGLMLLTPTKNYIVSARGLQPADAKPPGSLPGSIRGGVRVTTDQAGSLVFQRTNSGEIIGTIRSAHRLADFDPVSRIMMGTVPGGDSQPLTLISIVSGKPVANLTGAGFTVAARFLPDGTILSVHNFGKVLRRDRSGKVLATLKMPDTDMKSWNGLVLSNDGSKFVHFDSRYRRLEIRNTKDLTLNTTLAGALRRVKACTFSRGGKLLAIGDWDGLVDIFDAKSGRLVNSFPGHLHPINEVCFFEQGKYLASIDTGAKVRIWKVDTPSAIQLLSDHKAQVEFAHLMNGERVLSIGAGWAGKRTMISRDLTSGKVVRRSDWTTYTHSTESILVSLQDGSVHRLNPETLVSQRKSSAKFALISDLFLLNGGKRLLVKSAFDSSKSSKDPSSRYSILDAETLEVLSTFHPVWPGPVFEEWIALSNKGDHFVIGGVHRDEQTWKTDLGGTLHAVSISQGAVARSINLKEPFAAGALTPDGRHLVVAMKAVGKDFESEYLVFDAANLTESGPPIKGRRVDALQFDPSGKFMAGFHANGLGQLWDFPNRKLISTLNAGAGIRHMNFSPDGERLITSATNRATIVWNAKDGSERYTLRYDAQRRDDQFGDIASDRAEFTADGRQIIMACTDGGVRIWRTVPWR